MNITNSNGTIKSLLGDINEQFIHGLNDLGAEETREKNETKARFGEMRVRIEDRKKAEEQVRDAKKAEAAKYAVDAWPMSAVSLEKPHILANVFYLILMLIVAVAEMPLNKIAFEFLRLPKTETLIATICLGLVVALAAHFSGFLFKRAFVKREGRGVHIVSAILITLLFSAILVAVALIRQHYMEFYGLETIAPAYYVVMAGGLYIVGVVASALHASTAVDLRSENGYNKAVKDYFGINKKIKKLQQEINDIDDELTKALNNINVKYEKKRNEMRIAKDKEEKQLLKDHQQRMLKIEEEEKKKQLEIAADEAKASKIKNFTGTTVLLIFAGLSAMLSSCTETVKQERHDVKILVDQTEMFLDRQDRITNDGLIKLFDGETEYGRFGTISFGVLDGTTAKNFGYLEKFPINPEDNNLMITDQNRQFQNKLVNAKIGNILKPVEVEAEQSSIYQPLCAVLSEIKKLPEGKKTLVLVSDMVENSTNSNFYKIADRLLSDSEYAKEVAKDLEQKSCIFPTGTNIEIIIIYTPKEARADKYHNASMRVWSLLFAEAGISYTVQSGIN